MYDDPGLEQRLSRFEAQLDRFSLALHQWQAHEHSPASPDVDSRIRTLEETLDREAHALRLMHEEPLKQMQSQAARLQDLCATVQTLLAELQTRGGVPAAVPAKAAAWPLERVVHLHDELRRDSGGNGNGHALKRSVVVEAETAPDRERPRRRLSLAVGAAAIVVMVLVVVLARWVVGRLDDAANRVASAERQVEATTRLANEDVRAAREDATRQIAEARSVAQRAETVGSILTAPDLIRFNLTSTLADGSSAQVLWSRTRGVVMSGSRLPGAGANRTYQLWLVTGRQPVSAGVFVPDATGRATLIVDPAPRVAGPVVGAEITIEPGAGQAAPTGQVLLTRLR